MSARDLLCSLYLDGINVRRKYLAWNMSFLQNSHSKTKELTRQPKGQEQANPTHTSQPHPQSLVGKSCLPPSPKPDIVPVKTPQPAITVGFDYGVVVAAMMKRGAGQCKSSDFLEYLQVQKSLSSNPPVVDIPVRFPFMVVKRNPTLPASLFLWHKTKPASPEAV